MVRFRGYALVDKAAYDSVSQKAAQAVGVLVGGRKGKSTCFFKGKGVEFASRSWNRTQTVFVVVSLANEMADFSKRADLHDRIDQGRRCFSDENGVDLRNISMLEDANSWTAVRREPTILACFNLPLNWRCEGLNFEQRAGEGRMLYASEKAHLKQHNATGRYDKNCGDHV